MGTIRFPKYRPHMAVYTINKKDQLKILFEIFLGRICTEHTKKKIESFYKVSLPLKSSLGDSSSDKALCEPDKGPRSGPL